MIIDKGMLVKSKEHLTITNSNNRDHIKKNTLCLVVNLDEETFKYRFLLLCKSHVKGFGLHLVTISYSYSRTKQENIERYLTNKINFDYI